MVMFSVGFTRANPIMSPPSISEFYIVNDSTWYLELVIQSGYYYNTNLDGLVLNSSSGSAQVKNGITVTFDTIMILTQDSMQSPLHFNRNGDFLTTNGIMYDYLYFGNIPGSAVTAPSPGQSIVNLGHSCLDAYTNQHTTDYYYVKDNNPTIGYDAFQPSSAIGTFTGFVYDAAHNPVAGVRVGNSQYINIAPSYICQNFYSFCITDTSGRFTSQEYSYKRNVSIFFYSPHVLLDSMIYLEPDSINYFEFTLDTLLTGTHSYAFEQEISLSCSPNPSTGETNISFTISSGRHHSKALIKIYDQKSEIVRILPVDISNVQNNYSIRWDGICYDHSAASGTYYCTLELDGRKAAAEKVIIAK
jgi:hypothetical protein